MGLAYYYRGDREKAFEAGQALLDYGEKQTSIRSSGLGHFVIGCSHIGGGDFQSAIESLQRAIEISADPWFSQFPRLLLGFSYVSTGQFEAAEATIKEIEDYSQQFGTELIRTPACTLLGVITIAKGHLSRGLRILEDAQQEHLKNERRYVYATAEDIIGSVYLQIVEGAPVSLSMIKNIGFLVKNVPFASQKAEAHLNKSIEAAEEIGAIGTLGIAHLDLGLLHKARGNRARARECIAKAIECFDQGRAETYLKQAKEALGSLA
jgi:tetratricopeptide (TPR) repeat protein